MRRQLLNSVTKSALYLTLPIAIVSELAAIIWIRNDIKLAKEANITDIFSNAFNIVALYATIFFVLKLTSEAATNEKGTDVEKNLVTDRLKALYARLESLHEQVESGRLNFTETVIAFDRIDRGHESILMIIGAINDTVSVDSQVVGNYGRLFDSQIFDCKEVLTFTPPRSTLEVTGPTYVTISENVISVLPNGIQKASTHLTDLKNSIDELIIHINRA